MREDALLLLENKINKLPREFLDEYYADNKLFIKRGGKFNDNVDIVTSCFISDHPLYGLVKSKYAFERAAPLVLAKYDLSRRLPKSCVINHHEERASSIEVKDIRPIQTTNLETTDILYYCIDVSPEERSKLLDIAKRELQYNTRKMLWKSDKIYADHITALHPSFFNKDGKRAKIIQANIERNLGQYIRVPIDAIGTIEEKCIALRVDKNSPIIDASTGTVFADDITAICSNETPHITISTNNGAKPVLSNTISNWKPIKSPDGRPIYIEGEISLRLKGGLRRWTTWRERAMFEAVDERPDYSGDTSSDRYEKMLNHSKYQNTYEIGCVTPPERLLEYLGYVKDEKPSGSKSVYIHNRIDIENLTIDSNGRITEGNDIIKSNWNLINRYRPAFLSDVIRQKYNTEIKLEGKKGLQLFMALAGEETGAAVDIRAKKAFEYSFSLSANRSGVIPYKHPLTGTVFTVVYTPDEYLRPGRSFGEIRTEFGASRIDYETVRNSISRHRDPVLDSIKNHIREMEKENPSLRAAVFEQGDKDKSISLGRK